MKSNLRRLLEEFLPDDVIDSIEQRAKEMSLKTGTVKPKGRKAKQMQKLLEARGRRCQICGTEDRLLTIDHIIPKQLLLDMGLEDFFWDEDNFELMCKECNVKKSNRLDFDNSKTVALLEKYLKLFKARQYESSKKDPVADRQDQAIEDTIQESGRVRHASLDEDEREPELPDGSTCQSHPTCGGKGQDCNHSSSAPECNPLKE
jgi:5-methylcytosine-specific restriction endonuclease McrA